MRGAATSKPRVISAGDTFFVKYVVSSAFLLGAILLVWTALRDWGAHAIDFSSVSSLLLIPPSLLIVWSLGRLKRVALSETSLYVSNFLREIEVPLTDVSGIGEIEGRGYRVVIEFKRDTAFGRQIRFSPQGLSPPHPHPVVAELRAALAARR